MDHHHNGQHTSDKHQSHPTTKKERHGGGRKMFCGNSVVRQTAAAFISSLSIFSAGNSYAWIAPLLYGLERPGSILQLTPDQGSWVVALIELGNLFAPIPTGFVVDMCGRKLLLLITGPIYIVAWVVIVTFPKVYVLYIVRIIQGVAMAIQFTVLPMYLGEIAGPTLRGALSAFFQGMWYLGILYEYAFGAKFGYIGLTWLSIIPPSLFVLLFIWCPESPYYLVMKGKHEKAAKALSWLRAKSTEDSALKEELKAMQESIKDEQDNKGGWTDIVGTRKGRKALIIVQLVAMTEIMSGLTTILVYVSETLTKTSGNPATAAEFTALLGVLLVLVTVATAFLVDRFGRRPILLISTVGGAICLFFAALYYYLLEVTTMDVTSISWIPYVTIIGFMCLISFGIGAILPILQTEFFSNSTRGIASGITIFFLTLLSFICLKMYQVIEYNMGLYVNYTIFFAFTLFGAFNVFFFLPETKGKTFAEIQKML